MRALIAILLTGGLVAAGSTVAATGAQPPTQRAATAQSPSQTKVEIDVKVSPNKAGTKRKPRGVRVKATTTLKTPPQFEPPILQRARIYLSKYGLYNGAKYPKCSKSRLNRKGPGGCPKGSIMGKATGDAFADTVITHPRITIVNGGANRVYFYTVLNNPARVQTAVEGKITKLRGNPKYGYRLDFTVPQVLQVVAGVPIQVTRITGSAGRKDWLANTGCPRDRLWRGEGVGYFDNGGNSGVINASTPCRP